MQTYGFGQAPSSAWRVFSLLRNRLPATALLLVLILITSALDIAIPFFTQHLIDGIVRGVSGVRQFALPMLFISLAAIFASVATARVLRSVYNYRLFKTAAGIEDEIKSAAFENFLNWDTGTLRTSNTGQVIGNLDRGGTAIFVTLFERGEIGTDLVLTDVNLKGELSGGDLLSRIREHYGYGKGALPVLVMTGDDNPGNQAALLRAGANDLVQKPIEERLLVTKLLFQLRVAQRLREQNA